MRKRAVFRIRNGSGSADPLQWTTDPDTALFFGDFQDANTKVKFCPKFFCFFLSEGTFTSVFKDNKFLRSHKNCRNQGFSSFLHVVGLIRKNNYRYGSGSGRTQKLTVPTNPEPEHCEYEMIAQVG
jgi:hypothetical protein